MIFFAVIDVSIAILNGEKNRRPATDPAIPFPYWWDIQWVVC